MRELHCLLFGHRLKISKHVTEHIKEYQCTCCKEKFTTSPTGNIISLTESRERVNLTLQNIHGRKLRRKGISYNI